MSSNDQVLLDNVLQQRRVEVAPDMSASDFFEYFSVEQILKDRELSYEDIELGIVGGGGDGGVDGIFTFLNGDLLYEDADLGSAGRDPKIEFCVVQSKLSSGFSESSVEKINSFLRDALDLTKKKKELKTVYKLDVLGQVEIVRNAIEGLASRFPQVSVKCYYATKGFEVHANVRRKTAMVEETVSRLLPNAKCTFDFVGAGDLLEMARRLPRATHNLKLADSPISTEAHGFVALVGLEDFVRFISHDDGTLNKNLFESNVRDYQGSNPVNDEIKVALRQPTGEDFWWLNNGVTIVGARVEPGVKALTIENPEIVNGLQTSTLIHDFWTDNQPKSEVRRVLVRVVVPGAADSRDRIIKATNRQTPVQPASLRATDKIQRDIEEYLLGRGIYYDRRKNFYKNLGKRADRIIGIGALAQMVMATVLGQPNDARARPSSLMKVEDQYREIFNVEYPLSMYWLVAELHHRVVAIARSSGLTARDRNNIRFYVLYYLASIAAKRVKPAAKVLGALDIKKISDANIKKAIDLVLKEYEKAGGTDQVAKGADFVEVIRKRVMDGVRRLDS